jgi:ACS family hexuronate transporter-like MFS transporter
MAKILQYPNSLSQLQPVQETPAPFRPVFTRTGLILLVSLLLGETTINFIDRQVVSVLAPTLRAEFHLTNSDYAAIVNAFLVTYALSYSFAGWVLDRLGVGRGLALAITWWSGAGMLTAFARGPLSLGFFRSLLAVGEGGAWPAFAKAVSIWIPPEARTLAIGVCNSGSSLGAMIAPPLVAFITTRTSWRFSFVATGAIGFLWVASFLLFQRANPEMARAERDLAAGPAPPGLRWSELIRYRQTWAIFACRFLADPLWYFYVFWIPEFLTRERGLNLVAIGAVAWIPFLAADLSNFTGGYITLRLQRAGWSADRTRKTMMAAGALASPIGIFAVFAHSIFWTIGLISIAVFFWMFWSISVHTLAGDYFPPRAVASVYGIAGTGSTIGSVISTWAVGKTLDVTHSYAPVFVGIGVLMPFAMLIGFTLMKKVEPVALPDRAR